MRKATKEYGFNNLAGCVTQRKTRRNGTLVGLYHSEQSGMESDPELPWSTVCEKHHTLVCHPTFALASANLSYPEEWCEDCMGEEKTPS